MSRGRWERRGPWALLVVSACAPVSPAKVAPAREYTGPLVASQDVGESYLWQQEIAIRKGVFSHAFSAVLQSSRGELTVLGLTPFRTRAFVIRQKGRGVEYESFVDQELPLEPRWVLIDIHRTFFDGVPQKAPADGLHEGFADGERRADRWSGGRLLERTYERVDEPGPLIRIDYGEGYRWLEPPPRIQFDNGWYGYRLEVTTTSATALDEGASEGGGEP